jgi:riboflavin kinase/FMN adenylyltransferase
MKILLNNPDPITINSVCALGNFDGVHIAHQEIIKRVKDLAGDSRKTGIITFHPPPVSILHKDAIFFLTTKKEKERILRKTGIDFIYYFKFDEEFSKKSPEEFIELIRKFINPSTIIIGENFHFGKERIGTAKSFKELARGKFTVEILPKIKDAEGPISSTRIRELLILGNIPKANTLLGRNYSIIGKVVRGKGKGRTIGFPTINLKVDKEKLLPLDGVYEVNLDIERDTYKGAMFLSHNNIEVHILNFSDDLYGRNVEIRLIRRIREIKKFVDDESLRKAIAEDIKRINQET